MTQRSDRLGYHMLGSNRPSLFPGRGGGSSGHYGGSRSDVDGVYQLRQALSASSKLDIGKLQHQLRIDGLWPRPLHALPASANQRGSPKGKLRLKSGGVHNENPSRGPGRQQAAKCCDIRPIEGSSSSSSSGPSAAGFAAAPIEGAVAPPTGASPPTDSLKCASWGWAGADFATRSAVASRWLHRDAPASAMRKTAETVGLFRISLLPTPPCSSTPPASKRGSSRSLKQSNRCIPVEACSSGKLRPASANSCCSQLAKLPSCAVEAPGAKELTSGSSSVLQGSASSAASSASVLDVDGLPLGRLSSDKGDSALSCTSGTTSSATGGAGSQKTLESAGTGLSIEAPGDSAAGGERLGVSKPDGKSVSMAAPGGLSGDCPKVQRQHQSQQHLFHGRVCFQQAEPSAPGHLTVASVDTQPPAGQSNEEGASGIQPSRTSAFPQLSASPSCCPVAPLTPRAASSSGIASRVLAASSSTSAASSTHKLGRSSYNGLSASAQVSCPAATVPDAGLGGSSIHRSWGADTITRSRLVKAAEEAAAMWMGSRPGSSRVRDSIKSAGVRREASELAPRTWEQPEQQQERDREWQEQHKLRVSSAGLSSRQASPPTLAGTVATVSALYRFAGGGTRRLALQQQVQRGQSGSGDGTLPAASQVAEPVLQHHIKEAMRDDCWGAASTPQLPDAAPPAAGTPAAAPKVCFNRVRMRSSAAAEAALVVPRPMSSLIGSAMTAIAAAEDVFISRMSNPSA